MNKKSIKMSIIASTIVAAIIVACFFIFKPMTEKNENPVKTPQGNTSTTQGSDPKETPNASQKPKKEEDIVKTPEHKDGELSITKVDPNSLDAVEGFNKQEVANAIVFLNDYATISLSNKYFLSGQWAEEGYPIDKIKAVSSQFYSKNLVDKLDKSNDMVGEKFINSVMPYAFYLGDNGYSSPSKYCDNTKNEVKKSSASQCPINGVEVSEIKYISKGDAKAGYKLGVEFSATADIPININENNTDGLVTVTYDYKLLLDRIITNGKVKYEITSYNTSYDIENAREVNTNE